MNNQSPLHYITPLAILISGIAIAVAIFFNTSSVPAQTISIKPEKNVNTDAFIQVTKNDHILGDLDTAEVIIVDYSDLECPFCKILHETLMRVYKNYESTGKVAWVFRHYPMSFHARAIKEAEATECVAELGGNSLFWDYVHTIFANTPSNDGLDPANLRVYAKEVGVDETAFDSCLASGKYAQKIQDSYTNALKITGTEISPFTIVIHKDKVIPLVDANGIGLGAALPYAGFISLIDQLLASSAAEARQ
jgi:protein-disulfide isomerase